MLGYLSILFDRDEPRTVANASLIELVVCGRRSVPIVSRTSTMRRQGVEHPVSGARRYHGRNRGCRTCTTYNRAWQSISVGRSGSIVGCRRRISFATEHLGSESDSTRARFEQYLVADTRAPLDPVRRRLLNAIDDCYLATTTTTNNELDIEALTCTHIDMPHVSLQLAASAYLDSHSREKHPHLEAQYTELQRQIDQESAAIQQLSNQREKVTSDVYQLQRILQTLHSMNLS